MYKILLTMCVVFLWQVALSQEAISVSYDYGKIAVHTPLIEPLIKGPVKGFTINYAFSNSQGLHWRRLYNFPGYGLSYHYKDYGNPAHLGSSHAVTGFIQIPLLRIGDVLSFGFKGLTGVGMFTNKYDAVENPVNKAISSSLNITAETRLFSRISFHPVFIEYSSGLNHFSNGLVKAPNLGINVINNNISLGYYFEERVSPAGNSGNPGEKPARYEIWGATSIGIKQIDNEPKTFLFTGLTVNFTRVLSPVNKLGIGYDFHKDPALVLLAKKYGVYEGYKGLSYRYGLNLNHEFLFGNTAFYTGYGYYLKDIGYNPSRRYYKAGFKYYCNNIIGMALIRAIPLFRADVVEFGIGYRLQY